jgi:PAB-dependent poly(A)-specific ribonuclease subunit 2
MELFNSTPANSIVSTFAQEGHTLVAVSDKAEFLVMNTKTGTVGRQMPCPPQVVNLHVSHSLVFSGSSDGLLRTHDLRGSMKRNSGTELSVRAHQGSIQAIESSGNWVYTIGWTIRCVTSFSHTQTVNETNRNGRPTPDSQVKIFDTRNLKTMSSFNFANGPSLLNVHPLKSTSLILTANTGVVNVVDILKPDASEFYQVRQRVDPSSC